MNKHFHLIFITTDETSLHCLQVALKVWAKLAKVLKAAFSSEAGHQLSSVCCLRSLATSTQQLVQEKREKGRSTGERIGKAGYGHGQRNRIFHTRRSSCAVCYCAIFGTAVLSAANSSSLDLKLVFSTLSQLGQSIPRT